MKNPHITRRYTGKQIMVKYKKLTAKSKVKVLTKLLSYNLQEGWHTDLYYARAMGYKVGKELNPGIFLYEKITTQNK